MKIVICNNRYFPSSGPETYLFGLKEWLEGKGHAVHPFSVRLPGNYPAPDEDLFAESFGGLGKYLYRDYIKDLSPLEKVKVGLQTIYSVDAQQRFGRLLERVRPDLVYTLNIANMLTPSIVYEASHRGVPVVARISDYHLSCAAYGYFRNGQQCFECRASLASALRHRCVQGSLPATAVRVAAIGLHRLLGLTRRIGAFIAPSRFMVEDLIRLGIPSERVYYVPTPMWTLEAVAALPAGELEAVPTVAFVGRVAREKGLEFLLGAFRQLKTACRLWVIGQSSNNERERLVDGFGSDTLNRVDFLGPRFGDDLYRLVSRAHCVAVPSLWPDNSPNVVIEALALGKPVVATRVGGIPDQVDPDCAVLVEPWDHAALASALESILSDPARREAMGRQARARAAARFAPEIHLDRVLDIFNQARGARAAAPAR